jgi:UDP-glucose 4-epimerase
MSRVLVTGGLGFVGSNLVEVLVRRNHQVTVIDNLCSESSSRSYMRPDVEYWIDDVRNLDRQKYAGHRFDRVFHLAALARIQPSFADPVGYISSDVMGTAHVLEYARNCGAERLVYAGSSSAYGGPMLNPYAWAKYTGEQACQMYSEVYGMNTVVARFFNVYGPRQPRTGAWATVVGIFEEQSLKGQPLTVTGDGEQRRDFTHISDIAEGLIALSQEAGLKSGEIYNLGTGKNHSINELARMFGDEIAYIPQRPGEARTTLADISRTTEATGWQPRFSIEDYAHQHRLHLTGQL